MLTENLDFSIGYSMIYWSSVALAGDQIDTSVNNTQVLGGGLNGPANPAFNGIQDSGFWVQGINLGLNLRF